jgi:hypothetical protein
MRVRAGCVGNPEAVPIDRLVGCLRLAGGLFTFRHCAALRAGPRTGLSLTLVVAGRCASPTFAALLGTFEACGPQRHATTRPHTVKDKPDRADGESSSYHARLIEVDRLLSYVLSASGNLTAP